MANEEYPFTTFNFEVQIEIPDAAGLGVSSPLCNSEFAEVDGLEMTMEPKTLREGGNNTRQVHLIGPTSYGNLTLKRGMTTNQDIWVWFQSVINNTRPGSLATGVILMKDGAGTPVVRYTISDCLPIKLKAPALNAKDGILAIEELQIAYGAFTVERV
ncbi:MAG TPA: phage tail protein [Thermomicrobiales bacterium]|nr:phage tail protein [Thermomicrobiales bacterium]